MDNVYDGIFQALYSTRSLYADPGARHVSLDLRTGEPTRVVRRTIEDAERTLEYSGLRLRSDARFFLLVNLTEMVFVPVQIRGADPRLRQSPEELEPILRGDLELLLSEAARRHMEQQEPILGPGQEPDREISGHSVVEALAANWTRLKVNSFRIWGER